MPSAQVRCWLAAGSHCIWLGCRFLPAPLPHTSCCCPHPAGSAWLCCPGVAGLCSFNNMHTSGSQLACPLLLCRANMCPGEEAPPPLLRHDVVVCWYRCGKDIDGCKRFPLIHTFVVLFLSLHVTANHAGIQWQQGCRQQRWREGCRRAGQAYHNR